MPLPVVGVALVSIVIAAACAVRAAARRCANEQRRAFDEGELLPSPRLCVGAQRFEERALLLPLVATAR